MNIGVRLFRKLEELDPKIKDVFLSFMEKADDKQKIIAAGKVISMR
ncbi:MAG: hypothetical protein WCJ49_01390 [Deltaproteobacteria bacterium]